MKNYKKILLVGGEGYVGSVVKSIFINEGYLVHSIDNLIYNNQQSVLSVNNNNYKFIYGDMISLTRISNINQYDLIILFAGLVGDPVVKKFKSLSKKTNFTDVDIVINYLAKNYSNNFFFISTCSNYGLMDSNEKADEKYKLNPISDYSKAKVSAEKTIINLRNSSNFKPTIFRFATAFGISPRMRFDLTLNQFALDIYHDIPLTVYDPDTWRPYCHVKDFANILINCYQISAEHREFQIFNAGFNSNHSTKRNLINLIVKIFNKDMKNVSFKKENGDDQRNYKVDFNKITKLLNLEKKYSIEDGIVELKYFMDNNIFNNYKLNTRMGNFKIKKD